MKTEFVPYYAVIFSSIQTDQLEGYSEMAEKMELLAKNQPGFIALESARSGLGITVSYWKTLADISNWKKHSEHVIAQELGRFNWYDWYHVRICKVEREYTFQK